MKASHIVLCSMLGCTPLLTASCRPDPPVRSVILHASTAETRPDGNPREYNEKMWTSVGSIGIPFGIPMKNIAGKADLFILVFYEDGKVQPHGITKDGFGFLRSANEDKPQASWHIEFPAKEYVAIVILDADLDREPLAGILDKVGKILPQLLTDWIESFVGHEVVGAFIVSDRYRGKFDEERAAKLEEKVREGLRRFVKVPPTESLAIINRGECLNQECDLDPAMGETTILIEPAKADD